MRLVPLELESKLREKRLWPESRTARAGVYVLVLDLLFFVVQMLTSRLFPKVASSLGGWVSSDVDQSSVSEGGIQLGRMGEFSQWAGDCSVRDRRLSLAAVAEDRKSTRLNSS